MKNILVVDDTKSIRKLLRTCLELNGFIVETADDGKAALEFLMKKSFDLVFLDIKLPIVSGTEVLRRMREKGMMVPVVVITAFGNVKNAIDCTKLGAVAYVQKPFTANRIGTVLDELGFGSSGTGSGSGSLDEARRMLEKEQFQEVCRYLKNILAGDPLNDEIYQMLAQASRKLGKPEEAEKYQRLYEAIHKT